MYKPLSNLDSESPSLYLPQKPLHHEVQYTFGFPVSCIAPLSARQMPGIAVTPGARGVCAPARTPIHRV